MALTLQSKFKYFLIIAGILLLIQPTLFAQTAGKVAGRVVDASTGEPMPGVDVLLEGTGRGAATDVDGYFFIVNLPPGTYQLRLLMIGFQSVLVENVQVSVNRTATIDVEMKEAVVEGQEVVVTAEKISIKKDQTASMKNISSDQIAELPVDDLQAVIEQQAGIVAGHFRGGRLTEVSYLVDGVQIDDNYGGTSATLEPENEVVQDLEVITGTFNAEYGRALSGIVNVITKDGSNEYHGSLSSSVSNYYTSNSDVFIGLSNSEVDRNKDYKFNLTGPLLRDKVFFVANYRYHDRLGHHNGINRFLADDFSNFTTSIATLTNPGQPLLPATESELLASEWAFADDGQSYYSEHRGDDSFVPMSTSIEESFFGKLTYKATNSIKLSLLASRDRDEYNAYDDNGARYSHSYKYIPTTAPTQNELATLYLFQLNHLLGKTLFYDLKFSFNEFESSRYLFEDPLDQQYVSPSYDRSGAGGFRTGGQDFVHTDRQQQSWNAKFDVTWQLNKRHSLQVGGLYTQHRIENKPLVVETQGVLSLVSYDPLNQRLSYLRPDLALKPNSSIDVDNYDHEPFEFSAYVQDKMEFDAMVINLGLRYDFFDPNTVFPSQLRNPANQLSFPNNPERMSTYPKADPKVQLSPRFGLAYRVGEIAVVRFSYGHFFQVPPFPALYQNSKFLVPPGDLDIVHGNPQIKPERTIQYEFGVWMELMRGMGLELAVYNRDIYDLQSATVITTYNQTRYGLFSNKDFGNVKGLEIKYDLALQRFNFYLNYTLQYTRGNADDPLSSFNRIGESADPITQLIPLAWDQRHTLNFTMGYNRDNYGVNITTFFNSGLPYTFEPLPESPLSLQALPPNNAVRPANYNVDLRAHYDLKILGAQNVRLSLFVFNLLDRLNELDVNRTTGRAYTRVLNASDITTFRSNFNDILDNARNPGQFAPPREVKLVLGVSF